MSEDANTVETTESDSSSDVELTPIVDDEGLVSTVEFEPVQKPQVEETHDTDTSDGAEQSTPKDESPKDFHEHPRFQELIKEKNEMKRQLEEFKAAQSKKPERQQVQAPSMFERFANMSEDEIVEAQAENPRKFMLDWGKAIAEQTRAEVLGQLQAEQQNQERQTIEQKVRSGFESFLEETPDAKARWDSGEIKQFMSENPHHNLISAYYAMNKDALIQEAVEAARKDERDKLNKELRAKGRAGSAATSSPAPTSKGTIPPELKNPENFGGVKAAIVRLMQKEKAASV